MSEDSSVFFQLIATVVVVVLFVPGLIIEPGPLTEIMALSALASIWGFDWGGGE